MNYRLATERDFSQLAQMRWDFQTEDDPQTPTVDKSVFLESCLDFLRASLEKGDWAFWIAEEEAGETVAHVFVKRIVSVPRPVRLENFWGYLTNVYTKPSFRGRGIGAELLRQVSGWATAQDFELLIVSPGDAAIDFYVRAGFAPETDFFQLRLREF